MGQKGWHEKVILDTDLKVIFNNLCHLQLQIKYTTTKVYNLHKALSPILNNFIVDNVMA